MAVPVFPVCPACGDASVPGFLMPTRDGYLLWCSCGHEEQRSLDASALVES